MVISQKQQIVAWLKPDASDRQYFILSLYFPLSGTCHVEADKLREKSKMRGPTKMTEMKRK